MAKKPVDSHFTDLLDRIDSLPVEQQKCLEQLASESKNRRQRIKESISGLQDTIDYMRLSVKYLVFDLEATRRENIYLRKLIDESNRDASRRTEDESDERDSGSEYDGGDYS